MGLAPEFKKILDRARVLMLVLWVGFFASIVFLLFLPESFFRGHPVSKAYPYLTELENITWLLALAFALLLLWAKQRFYTVDAIFRAATRSWLLTDLGGETPTEKGAARLIYFYRFRMTRALVLSALIGVCGLLLSAMNPPGWEGRLFYLTSGALLVFFYPSKAFFDSLIKEYEHREVMYELDGRWGRL
ncbi:MAG TPA: hypothetical protein VGL11_18975 [Candidatus Binatia bacterium]